MRAAGLGHEAAQAPGAVRWRRYVWYSGVFINPRALLSTSAPFPRSEQCWNSDLGKPSCRCVRGLRHAPYTFLRTSTGTGMLAVIGMPESTSLAASCRGCSNFQLTTFKQIPFCPLSYGDKSACSQSFKQMLGLTIPQTLLLQASQLIE